MSLEALASPQDTEHGLVSGSVQIVIGDNRIVRIVFCEQNFYN